MSNEIIHLTDETFKKEVLESSLPVLVDYWAEWCGPCKMIAPILDSLIPEYEGRIKITKLNIDENSQTPIEYVVRSIPTLMIFKDGKVEATKVGALSKSDLMAFIDSSINISPNSSAIVPTGISIAIPNDVEEMVDNGEFTVTEKVV